MAKPKPRIINGLAYVPVSNRHGKVAVLDALDYYHLGKRALDVTALPWMLNDNGRGMEYLRVHIPGQNNAQVARLIMGEPPHDRVAYHDGNRLNLRRENLYLCSGTSRQGLAKRLE